MELLTRKEAASKLKIGLRTLDRRLAEGSLKCFRLGDGPKAPIRISDQHIADFLQSFGDSDSSLSNLAHQILRG